MTALDLNALRESADLSLRLQIAWAEVDRLGREMESTAGTLAGLVMAPAIVRRMERASAVLADAARDFHAAVARAIGGPPS